jgi:hypothetical protein
MWTDDDYDDAPRRRRRRHKAGPSAGLIVGLSVGGIFLLLVVGLGLQALLKKGGKSGGPPALFARPVTENDYATLPDGATLDEVEARLGPGRAATADDIATITGRRNDDPFAHPAHQNQALAASGVRDYIRVWGTGSNLLLVIFSTPDRSGRVAGKMFRAADGTTHVSYGLGSFAAGGVPTTVQEPAFTRVAANVLLPEFAARKYANRILIVSGTMTRYEGGWVIMEVNGSTLAARVDAAKKRPGDLIVVSGTMQSYTPQTRRLTIDGGKLHF